MQKFSYLVLGVLFSINLNANSNRLISVDLNKEKGKLATTFKECVGAGRAFEGLGLQWQKQLREVKKDCDFTYIRFHALLHDEMEIYKEDAQGNPIYNWNKMDQLFDFLLEIKMKPFVELSFMPAALRTNDQTVFHWKAYVSPPNSYPKYEALIEALVRHVEQRYGKEEIKTWYFEVWNEPNHKSFFTGNREEYFKIYNSAAKAVKKVDAAYKIGGPATAGTGWINEIMDYTKSNNVPLDFISTHAYGVKGDLDETGNKVLIMRDDPDYVAKAINGVRRKIEATDYKGLELHITEWSSSYSPRDEVHDSYQNAAYVLNTLKKTENVATSMSYWTFTDIFEELGQSDKPFHGGFGLMTIDNLKKPTYFAYKYLNQLGDTELVNADSSSIVCKKGNDVQALFWDFSFSKQKGVNNAKFYTQDKPSLPKGITTIKLSNLKNGKYSLELYKTGYKQNDIFTAYVNIGKPTKLNATQMKELAAVSQDLVFKKCNVKVKNGQFSYDVALNENDIYFLKLLKK